MPTLMRKWTFCPDFPTSAKKSNRFISSAHYFDQGVTLKRYNGFKSE
jgi:hypothetical protein